MKMRIYFRTLYLKIHNITPPLPCHHRKHGLNRKLEEVYYSSVLEEKILRKKKKIYIYYISENTLSFAF